MATNETTTETTGSNIVQTEKKMVGDLEVSLTRFRDGTVIFGFAKWGGVYSDVAFHIPLTEMLKVAEMIQRLAPVAASEPTICDGCGQPVLDAQDCRCPATPEAK